MNTKKIMSKKTKVESLNFHIEKVDVLHVRNMPVPKVKGEKGVLPEYAYSSIVSIHARAENGQTFNGLGEIRAMNYLTGEAPLEGFNFAQVIAKEIIDSEFNCDGTGWTIAESTDSFITSACKKILGIRSADKFPSFAHPAVRLGFDAALLDICAKIQGTSVADMIGIVNANVQRNVTSTLFGDPGLLIKRFASQAVRPCWLRGKLRGNSKKALVVLSAAAAAASTIESKIPGVWFDLDSKWSYSEFKSLLNSISTSRALANSGLGVIIEQPFDFYSTGFYDQAIEDVQALSKGLNVRLMLDYNKEVLANPSYIQPFLPEVDLRIVPQEFGSLYRVNQAIKNANENGFKGAVYLGNAGMSTELNSIFLLTLAMITKEIQYFSATPKNEDSIKQVFPQVSFADKLGTKLNLPEGEGFGTRLCQSLLKKRIVKIGFLRSDELKQDAQLLKQSLILNAIDDSTVAFKSINEVETYDQIETEDDYIKNSNYQEPEQSRKV